MNPEVPEPFKQEYDEVSEKLGMAIVMLCEASEIHREALLARIALVERIRQWNG